MYIYTVVYILVLFNITFLNLECVLCLCVCVWDVCVCVGWDTWMCGEVGWP